LTFRHPYIPNSNDAIKKEMLKEIGVESIDDLYRDIPEKFRLKRDLNIPRAHSEMEVFRKVKNILKKNVTFEDMPIFLGAGVWPHYVPSVVKEIVRRGEFLTSYTPYQPEISQGILQAFFEYQSLVAELLEMDVVNASVYDWPSALGEAALMCARLNKRKKFIVPEIIHPDRLSVLKTYTEPAGIIIEKVKYVRDKGILDLEDLKNKVDENVSGVYIENPSYLGFLETQVEDISQITHEKNALFVVGVDPTSLGVIKPPGSYDADIVIGEGQPLGSPVNFGGPLLGIFACRNDRKVIRQLPGRIIGLTTNLEGTRRGFVMTLTSREQHIKREKATSNICTNEGLVAIAAAAYLSVMGPEGMKKLGETLLYNARYACKKINEISGVKSPIFNAPHFKEFTVNFDDVKLPVEEIHKKLLTHGFHGGKIIKSEFPELGESALYCVTEIHSKEQILGLVNALKDIIEGEDR